MYSERWRNSLDVIIRSPTLANISLVANGKSSFAQLAITRIDKERRFSVNEKKFRELYHDQDRLRDMSVDSFMAILAV